MLNKQQLDELHQIILEEYNHDLSLAEVAKIGNDLVSAVKLLAKIQARPDWFI